MLLIKPGEVLQYMIEITGSSPVGTAILQYSTDGGAVWKQERGADGELISETGTMSSLQVLGWVKNETAKNRLYRWFVTAITSGTIPLSLSKNPQPVHTFSLENGIYLFTNPESPNSGVDGDGAQIAGAGSFYIDTSTGKTYRNEGNATLPMWVSF